MTPTQSRKHYAFKTSLQSLRGPQASPVPPEDVSWTLTTYEASGRVITKPIPRPNITDAVLGYHRISKRFESQYLHFDLSDPVDKRHVDQLKQGWKDAIRMASIVVNDLDFDGFIFRDYFAPEHSNRVKAVFESKSYVLFPF